MATTAHMRATHESRLDARDSSKLVHRWLLWLLCGLHAAFCRVEVKSVNHDDIFKTIAVETASNDPIDVANGAHDARATGGQEPRASDHVRAVFSGALPRTGLVIAREDLALPGQPQVSVVEGPRPGSTYVRKRLPEQRDFRARGEELEATEEVLHSHTVAGRGYEHVRRVIFGRRLATIEQVHERLTKVKALAVLSSDAISSVAYATEASLGVLITAGLATLRDNVLIACAIAFLMIVVGFSYRQTIHAYPHGGGSYIVARDNLGDWPGLVAAAALLIDYVLTVSVSVSAGVDALVSAVPQLQFVSVGLGALFIVFIMVVNLRGIRESATIFSAPTYIFIGAFLIMIVIGVIHAVRTPGGLLGAVTPTVRPVDLGWKPQQLGLLLVLTAFASGCSAMTGVEAISNGVPAFKAPESHNASRTLVWMIGMLVTLYLGATYLAWRFGIAPIEPTNPHYVTLISQIAALLFVGPFRWFYFVLQFATLFILVLAANTSFADFPRLTSILARDRFLPHQFSYRGDRLAFSTGIVVLSVLSIVLLVAFHGNTDALINLYALGVFTAFTLSQLGMVVRWSRLRTTGGSGWRRSLTINAIGAAFTGVVAAVIMLTKFDRGAWIVVVLVPLVAIGCKSIARHYATVQRQTRALTPLRAEELQHVMVVPISELNRPALQSLAYASSLSRDVIVLHISTDDEEDAAFREQWKELLARHNDGAARHAPMHAEHRLPTTSHAGESRAAELRRHLPRLVVVSSPYRSLVAPLIAYVDALRDANPARTVSVVLPEFVPAHWWERALHNQTALRLKLALYSDPGVVVVSVPYHLGT